MKRDIIKIDESKCDGLGACIGKCPKGAINIESREAEPYNEKRVLLENIIPKGRNTIIAHLKHLKEHGEDALYNEAIEVLREKGIDISDIDLKSKEKAGSPCMGRLHKFLRKSKGGEEKSSLDMKEALDVPRELNQWPIQLTLLNPNASFLEGCDLLVAADCTAFSYGSFHRDFMKGRITIIFCPKLDKNIEEYIDKLSLIFRNKTINSITIARMEVPCCGGVEVIVRRALAKANRDIPVEVHVINIS